MNQKNPSSTSPNDDVYLADISNIVYHATSKAITKVQSDIL
jgi:hypothetical protein